MVSLGKLRAADGMQLLKSRHCCLLARPHTGLIGRCRRYAQLGARFTKWRAVYTVDEARGYPSELCLTENAFALARWVGGTSEWEQWRNARADASVYACRCLGLNPKRLAMHPLRSAVV